MKIVIISNVFEPNNVGGAEKIAKIQAEYFSQSHEVHVITSIPYKNIKSLPLVEDGDQSKHYKTWRFFPANIYHYLQGKDFVWPARLVWNLFDVFNLHSYFVINKKISQINPDIILFNNLKGIGYISPILAQKYQCAFMLHDVQYAIPSGLMIKGEETQGDWLNNIYSKINNWLFFDIKHVFSPSEWLVDFYQEKKVFTEAKKHILPNPVPVSHCDITPKSLSGPLKLLFVGQIEPHKGLSWLLENIPSNIEISIVGDGSQYAELAQKYKERNNINFHGRVDGQAVADFYKKADYLIVPSICYENYPTVILEAFLQGLPVIGSNHGGIPELVVDKQTGYTFETGSVESLTQVLSQAAVNPNYFQMQQSCQQKVRNQTTEKYGQSIINTILE